MGDSHAPLFRLGCPSTGDAICYCEKSALASEADASELWENFMSQQSSAPEIEACLNSFYGPHSRPPVEDIAVDRANELERRRCFEAAKVDSRAIGGDGGGGGGLGETPDVITGGAVLMSREPIEDDARIALARRSREYHRKRAAALHLQVAVSDP